MASLENRKVYNTDLYTIWGAAGTSKNNVEQLIKKLRTNLEDDAYSARIIATLSGPGESGYRFLLHAYPLETTPTQSENEATSSTQMRELAEIKNAISRLNASLGSEEDRQSVQEALLTGRALHIEKDDRFGRLVLKTKAATSLDAGTEMEFSKTKFEQLYRVVFPKPKGLPPPFPNGNFLGRTADLNHIKGLLSLVENTSINSNAQAIVGGVPGVGKTTLVAALSRDVDVRRVYPDGVLWTSLGTTPELMLNLAGWGRALGGRDLLHHATAEDAIDHLRILLSESKVLLIVDDVWDAGHGALFQRLQTTHNRILFTTRLDKVAQLLSQTGEDIHKLKVLDEGDALLLFRLLAPQVAETYPTECLALVQDLGCLPLALHVAARLLRTRFKRGLSVHSLLDELRSGAEVLRSDAPSDRAVEGTIPTVQALLQKSTNLLSPTGRRCFALLGVFAPKPANYDLEAMQAVWDVSNAEPIVEELLDHGLLEPISKGRFQMHALLVAHAHLVATEYE